MEIGKIAIQGNPDHSIDIFNYLAKHYNLKYVNPVKCDNYRLFYTVGLFDNITAFDERIIQSRTPKSITLNNGTTYKIIKLEDILRQPKQKKRKHKIHKSNCVNKVRFTTTDQLGNTITVCGRYAFEWTININKNGMVIQTSFESRRKALNELRKLTGKKII